MAQADFVDVAILIISFFSLFCSILIIWYWDRLVSFYKMAGFSEATDVVQKKTRPFVIIFFFMKRKNEFINRICVKIYRRQTGGSDLIFIVCAKR